MSPTAGTTDAKPTPATAGHARTSPARGTPPARAASSARAAAVVEDSPAHEKSSATDDKILAALNDRMVKMESFQRERDENEKMLGAVESGMFASALGANMRARSMTIDALLDSLEQKPAAWHTSARVPELGESMFASLAPPTREHMPLRQHEQDRASYTAAAPRRARKLHHPGRQYSSRRLMRASKSCLSGSSMGMSSTRDSGRVSSTGGVLSCARSTWPSPLMILRGLRT